jgi:HAD superfamily hydrolase (TIGR01490 family)
MGHDRTGATAAFFDLDRTLLSVNSGLLWAQHERRQGNISRAKFARAGLWTLLYHLSLVDIAQVYATATRHYRGVRAAELDRRTRAWFEREIAPQLRPAAARSLADHRARGHVLVLLTSSSQYEAAAAAETFGLDHWLANHFPLDADGRLLGSYEPPLCSGPGKVMRAERWAGERGIDLARSFFYTDSFSDLPMLERVGEPRVVAPDPRLRREARRRGWPVLAW